VARKTKLFFATDVHGSEMCFRKFLNAGKAYGPDVLVLGGDIAGKAVQAVEDLGGGRFTTTFRGHRYDIDSDDELARVERAISDVGYYPWRAQPGELDQRIADGTVDDLLLDLMRSRLERWMELADERLRPLGKQAFWMLGNDDPPSLAEPLQAAAWGAYSEGRVLPIDDDHVLVSWGWANPTPWHSFREMSEEQLTAHFDEMFAEAGPDARVVFNAHVPPYGTGLDDAPMLDAELTVMQQAGQVKLGPVGSTAVRAAIERHQPVASVHGHVHESAGFRRIGRTVAFNPGSDYGTGSLNGALLTLSGEKLKSHQLVRG
jgi:Icc-related predicted phosphoesterase